MTQKAWRRKAQPNLPSQSYGAGDKGMASRVHRWKIFSKWLGALLGLASHLSKKTVTLLWRWIGRNFRNEKNPEIPENLWGLFFGWNIGRRYTRMNKMNLNVHKNDRPVGYVEQSRRTIITVGSRILKVALVSGVEGGLASEARA